MITTTLMLVGRCTSGPAPRRRKRWTSLGVDLVGEMVTRSDDDDESATCIDSGDSRWVLNHIHHSVRDDGTLSRISLYSSESYSSSDNKHHLQPTRESERTSDRGRDVMSRTAAIAMKSSVANNKIDGSNKTRDRLIRRRCRLVQTWWAAVLLSFAYLSFGGGIVILAPAEASLIIGDSAIEIQELESTDQPQQPITSAEQELQAAQQLQLQTQQPQQRPNEQQQPNPIIFGSSDGPIASLDSHLIQVEQEIQKQQEQSKRPSHLQMPGPLPPIVIGESTFGKVKEDITDGDKKSRNSHDYDINEFITAERQAEKKALDAILSDQAGSQEQPLSARPPAPSSTGNDDGHSPEKSITGKVVDFELQSAGGHNKAKIKIKKKKKKKAKEEMYKDWNKKKMAEKKAMNLEHKEHMKKKKVEGLKKNKKFGSSVHGHTKKGKFKKKKWGKKEKKGKGIKKGKKGIKMLKDKGHKNSGFKTVYHKEEWGKTSKWHDIERDKKWNEKSKKWKKKHSHIKGKKYHGDHMKKFKAEKKAGRKFKKESKDKFKKFKKEKSEKGKKFHMAQKDHKKEGGMKEEMKKKEMKKKKKKHHYHHH